MAIRRNKCDEEKQNGDQQKQEDNQKQKHDQANRQAIRRQ